MMADAMSPFGSLRKLRSFSPPSGNVGRSIDFGLEGDDYFDGFDGKEAESSWNTLPNAHPESGISVPNLHKRPLAEMDGGFNSLNNSNSLFNPNHSFESTADSSLSEEDDDIDSLQSFNTTNNSGFSSSSNSTFGDDLYPDSNQR
jgi:hypothetical protein